MQCALLTSWTRTAICQAFIMFNLFVPVKDYPVIWLEFLLPNVQVVKPVYAVALVIPISKILSWDK